METEKKPYAVEYAKSSRSSCKGCKSLISKDTLRIALMKKSSFYDGLVNILHNVFYMYKILKTKNCFLASTLVSFYLLLSELSSWVY